MSEVYLDNAAATRPDPRVLRTMSRAARQYGNPSSFNDAGRRAREVLETARADVARFLNARSSEVIFCSSGSEANALALAGAHRVLTQPTEHPSVLRSAGKRARFVPVDADGRVSPEAVARAIRSDTTIVSVMYVNNETGTVQPIKAIAKAIREWRRTHRTAYPYFHVDACQATSWLPMDVQALGVDLLTFNGTKVHGPAGIAVLYARRGVEHGARAGTENVTGAVGLATAVGLVRIGTGAKVSRLRDRLLNGLRTAVPGVRINTPASGCAPHIANISVPGASSEELLLELDRHGIRAGAGSACTAHAVEPSHVLVAIGTPKKYLDGALRFSLSRLTTRADIETLLRELPKAVVSCYNKRRSHYPSP